MKIEVVVSMQIERVGKYPSSLPFCNLPCYVLFYFVSNSDITCRNVMNERKKERKKGESQWSIVRNQRSS